MARCTENLEPYTRGVLRRSRIAAGKRVAWHPSVDADISVDVDGGDESEAPFFDGEPNQRISPPLRRKRTTSPRKHSERVAHSHHGDNLVPDSWWGDDNVDGGDFHGPGEDVAFDSDSITEFERSCDVRNDGENEIDWHGHRGGHRRHKTSKQQSTHTYTAFPQKPAKKHTETGHDRSSYLAFAVMMFLGAGIASGLVIMQRSTPGLFLDFAKKPSEDSYPYRTSPKSFSSAMAKLSEQFGSQPKHLWKVLSTRGVRHLKERSPMQPVVFLLAAEESGYGTLTCLASALGKTFSTSSVIHVNSSTVAARSDGSGLQAQDALHTELHKHLTHHSTPGAHQGSVPVVIVENLEDLPAPSPFLFFSYCDNSNAVSLQAVFIFTLRLPAGKGLPSSNEKSRERFVLQYLAEEVWHESKHEDYAASSVEALVTRISDVTVVVHPEPQDRLLAVCPH